MIKLHYIAILKQFKIVQIDRNQNCSIAIIWIKKFQLKLFEIVRIIWSEIYILGEIKQIFY